MSDELKKPDNNSACDAIDRLIHEPARLKIMTILYVVEKADFTFLTGQTGLTRGNLSSHMSKLEEAGYIEINKTFADKLPRTLLRLTESGRTALKNYRNQMLGMLDDLA